MVCRPSRPQEASRLRRIQAPRSTTACLGAPFRRVRLTLHKIESLQAYARYLDSHPEEVKALFENLLIPVTSFFRDPKAYDVLKTRILPKYLETFAPGSPFRVWVPGCSSGEEAYSIA